MNKSCEEMFQSLAGEGVLEHGTVSKGLGWNKKEGIESIRAMLCS
jgi:hypothetical protein